MAKWIYNSKLAKWLTPLGTCHTITLGCVVLTEISKDKVSQRLRNHENTHVKQFTELLIIGIVLYAVMALFNVSWWFIFPYLLLFYVWYGVEWLIRFIQCKFDWHKAYKAVAFEEEANDMEEKNENERLAFGFLRHYKAQDKHT